MYKNITEETVHFLNEWLHDNCKGSYNFDAWVNAADDALNNLDDNESHAVLELKAHETTTGHCLTFVFNK
jgi:hypothetical protein